MKTMPEILRELRTEKKKTQGEMSEILGLKRNAYQCYESGVSEPTCKSLRILADFYGVSTDYILGRTSIREMNTQDKWLPTPEEVEAVEQKIIDIYTQLSPKLRRAGIGMLMDIVGGFMPDLSRITAALEEEDDEPNESPA